MIFRRIKNDQGR